MDGNDREAIANHHISQALYKGFGLNGVLVLPAEGWVIRDKQRYHLSTKAMEVLLYLTEHHDQVLDSQQILEFAWGDANASRSLLTHIVSEIRHALGDHRQCPEFIQTFPKKGYRLIAELKPTSAGLNINRWLNNKENSPSLVSDAATSHWAVSWNILRSSKLFSVSVAFLLSTWALIQVLDVFLPIFDIPDWGLKIAVLLFVVGFPLVLLIVWIRDIKQRKLALAQKPKHQSKGMFYRQLVIDFSFFSSLSVAVGLLSLYLVESIETEQAQELIQTARHEQAIRQQVTLGQNSVAVLPFDFAGSDRVQYYRQIFQAELNSIISQQSDAQVVSQRVIQDYLDESSYEDLVNKLKVRYLIDGAISQSSDQLTVAASITDTLSNVQVWSDTVSVNNGNLLILQKKLYQSLLSALNLLFDKKGMSFDTVINTYDVKAYESYLQGKSQLLQANSLEELAAAELSLLKALSYDKSFLPAITALCQTYLNKFELGKTNVDFQRAEQLCQSNLRENDSDPEPYVALAKLARLKGDYQTAQNQLNKALEIKPNNVLAISELASVLLEIGDTDRAQAQLQRAIALEPGYWRNYQNYGDFLFGIGQYSNAIEQYNLVVYLKDDHQETYNRLGASFYLTNRFEEAAQQWRISLKFSPSATIYSNFGTALFFNKQFKEAEIAYQQAVNIKPSDPILWANLGDARKYLNKLETATQAYTIALSLAQDSLAINPEDISTQIMVLRYQSELGQCQPVVDQSTSFANQMLDDPYIYYDASIAMLNCQQVDLTKKFLSAAVRSGYSIELLQQDIQFSSLQDYIKNHIKEKVL